jgi:hypothetical protein
MLIVIGKCKKKKIVNSDAHYSVPFLAFPNKPIIFAIVYENLHIQWPKPKLDIMDNFEG